MILLVLTMMMTVVFSVVVVVVVAFAFSVDALVTFLMDFAVAAFVGGTSVVFLGRPFSFFTWVGHPLFILVGVVPSFYLGLFF